MFSPKRLLEMTKKRRGTSTKGSACSSSDTCNASIADKGHFVVYVADGKRFSVPLAYLKSEIFRELLKMSVDEFGLRGDGPIVLPCNATFLEHALSIIRGRASKEVEKELLSSLLSHHCSTSSSFVIASSHQLVSF